MSPLTGPLKTRFSRFLWPALYAAIKIRLLLLLLLGLLATPLFHYRLALSDGTLLPVAGAGASGVGPVSAAIWLAAIAFLFFCDWLIERRRGRFDRELERYVSDPELPDRLRERILFALLRERNRRH